MLVSRQVILFSVLLRNTVRMRGAVMQFGGLRMIFVV
jgi:hypothetical protein